MASCPYCPSEGSLHRRRNRDAKLLQGASPSPGELYVVQTNYFQVLVGKEEALKALADLQTAACGCIGVFVLALMTGLKDWTMSHNTTPVPFLVNLLFYELSKQHEMQSWEINRCYKAMFQNIQQSLKR